MLEILPEYNDRLCQVGALLISYRARFYEGLGREAKVFHETFSGGKESFRLEYQTVSTISDPFAPVRTLEQQLREHLERHVFKSTGRAAEKLKHIYAAFKLCKRSNLFA